jgi:hypothetical protein
MIQNCRDNGIGHCLEGLISFSLKTDQNGVQMNCVTVCRLCGTTVGEILTVWARTLGKSPTECRVQPGKEPSPSKPSNPNQPECLLEQMGFAADPKHIYDVNYDSIRWAAGVRYLNHGLLPQNIRRGHAAP